MWWVKSESGGLKAQYSLVQCWTGTVRMLKPRGASEILSGFPPERGGIVWVGTSRNSHISALHSETPQWLLNCGDSTLVTRSDSSRFGIAWVQSPMATTSTTPYLPSRPVGPWNIIFPFFSIMAASRWLVLAAALKHWSCKDSPGPGVDHFQRWPLKNWGIVSWCFRSLMDLNGHSSGLRWV